MPLKEEAYELTFAGHDLFAQYDLLSSHVPESSRTGDGVVVG